MTNSVDARRKRGLQVCTFPFHDLTLTSDFLILNAECIIARASNVKNSQGHALVGDLKRIHPCLPSSYYVTDESCQEDVTHILLPHSTQSGANTLTTTREIPRAKHGKLFQHSDHHLGGGRHREVRGGNQVGEILRLGWVD